MYGMGDVGPLLFGEVGATVRQPAQLGRDNLVRPGPQRSHRRRHVGTTQPTEEGTDLIGHDRFRRGPICG